jgi:O-antigen ligase
MTINQPLSDKPFERAIFFGLLMLIFSAPLFLTVLAGVDEAKWALIRIFGPLIFGLWIINRVMDNQFFLRWDPIATCVVAFFVIHCLSIIPATNKWLALTYISKQFGLVCIYFAVANIISIGRDRDGILWAITGVGTLIALYGILQHHGYDVFPWTEHTEVPVERGVSFIGHATFSASVLIAAIPISFGLGSSRTLFIIRIIPRICAVIMLYHLSFTGARVATVALFFTGLLVMLMIIIHKARSQSTDDDYTVAPKIHVKAIVGIVLLLVIGSAFVARAWSIKDSDVLGVRQASVAQRIYSWDTATRMFLDNPVLGVGAGNYGVASPEYWNELEATRYAYYNRMLYQPHNEYIEIAAEQGIIGISLFLLLIVLALSSSVYLWVHELNIKSQRIGLAIFAALLAISIDATFIFNLQQPASALIFWVLLGIISAEMARIKQNSPAPQDKILDAFPAG